jgi:hypothetical protein
MSFTIADLTTVLKLEVEYVPAGLTNLIPNPDGELGGWGWLTQVSNASMAGDPTNLKLTYSRSVSGASSFTTELIPITAGQYINASYKQQSAGNAYHRARFEWYGANKQLLSSSTQTGLVPPSGTTVTTVGAVQAPALTVYVALRIDLYTSGGANPTGAHTFAFTQATLVSGATSGAVSSVPWLPVQWTNILGPATEIKIERPTLDLGTLNAVIRDVALDPASATALRPNRKVRVTAKHHTSGL